MEDKMNLEHDVQEVGVQLILLVEDGIRFYSSILPNMLIFLFNVTADVETVIITRTRHTNHQVERHILQMKRYSMNTPLCPCVIRRVSHKYLRRKRL